jgi:hypothetical protein
VLDFEATRDREAGKVEKEVLTEFCGEGGYGYLVLEL